MSEYKVRIEVEISAGWPDRENYYTPKQLADEATWWIMGALDDRDDVHGTKVTVLEVEGW
jgi:hypothetical protein